MPKKRSGGGLTTTQQAAKFLGVAALSGVVLAGIALPAAGALGLAAKGTVDGFDEIPANLKTPPLSQRTTILDNQGGQIATVYSRDRTVVPLTKISPYMQKAIIAIEDARFYEHGAVDLKGILRAMNRNVQAGGTAQGASTLTQQYVKNVFVEEAGDDPTKVAQATQQTLGRKVQELKYAIQVEEELGKKKILENYLNITFFGQQAYGVEAASQRYFSKPAKDLKLEEAAMLAGIVQSPSRYDPVNDKEEATKRRNTVIQRMADVKDISQEEADKAKAAPIKLKVKRPKNGCITAVSGSGFFCDYVRQIVTSDPAFGKTAKDRAKLWATGGLTIKTTLDPRSQAASNEAATSRVNETDKVAASVVQVQPGTGQILAMAQSRPYGLDAAKHQTVLNLSVDHEMGGSYAGFQVGSTFKPITAAAALEKGISPAQSFTTPHEISLPGESFRTCDNQPADDKPWEVGNELETEKGMFDMTSALGKSINTYFAKLEQKTGLCETLAMAKKVGYNRGDNKPLWQVANTTLGGQESTPLAMASVYATFANRGTYCSPIAVLSVTKPDGKQIDVPKSTCDRAMSEHTADTINQMLKGVVADGTGQSAGLSDRDNAGKTGTTDERINAWFVGYTPNLSTAVWVGSDGARQIPMSNITIGGQYYEDVCGGCLPGPIWKTAMTGSLDASETPAFNPVDVPRAKPKEDKEKKEKKKPGEGDDKPGDDNPFPGISIPPDLLGGNDGNGRGQNDGGTNGP
ncbi:MULTISPECIES: transglycosylase domain-containing protein [Streptomyces]|uniref:Transglycosylase domain-containing protein n=1 Tax=Streptomyces poriferorum TaxID=2798799 RepID=A0ABY9IVF6_9ACTN|nr:MULTISPECIES: transglycosylase domain-containing protein [Streptomyces]MBW5253475.1 transglycosylase domain-containing protein [Streptomyces poriferorum]MBW5260107.1 transglycosylase domain-containing protein [Streptomyces poriferorum]MDP5312964.1 transglycosylase domain-containing protein [Streptomyces sp. Alt4]WLQ58032.1 transglycosylase domain-containing protein [Streptomyces sp. Alt2]WSI64107.1 transglycosylase domain-containing protein [Streptomyces sp. NBC_01336]